MVLLQDLVNYCDELLAIDQFQDYCPNGLQVEGNSSFRYNYPSTFRKVAALELGESAVVKDTGKYGGSVHGDNITYGFGVIDGFAKLEQGELISVAGHGEFEEFSLDSGENEVEVDVAVAVFVAVEVDVKVDVAVAVFVAVEVDVGVDVAVAVFVDVDVDVEVVVPVEVRVAVPVWVDVWRGVFVF